MGLLGPDDAQRLREDFAGMTRRVHLVFFTQTLDCDACPLTRQILDELAGLSDRIVIDEVNLVLDPDRARAFGIDRAPAIVITYEDEAAGDLALRDTRMRFVGAPAGYEFIGLVQAVLIAGGQPTRLSEPSLARLAALDHPVTMRVFSTPT
jgi:alkyl hydroperoxide reductase subunit AhpF